MFSVDGLLAVKKIPPVAVHFSCVISEAVAKIPHFLKDPAILVSAVWAGEAIRPTQQREVGWVINIVEKRRPPRDDLRSIRAELCSVFTRLYHSSCQKNKPKNTGGSIQFLLMFIERDMP